MGDELIDFQNDYPKYCGVKHCIGVGSGFAVLKLILFGCKEIIK